MIQNGSPQNSSPMENKPPVPKGNKPPVPKGNKPPVPECTGANSINKDDKGNSQNKNLRLQLVLLFYDPKDWGKLQKDDEGFICQESSKMKEYPFEIKGGTQSKDEIVEQYLFPIQEKLQFKKGKISTEIEAFQNKIIQKIESIKTGYSTGGSQIDKIYLDILYPTDNSNTGPKDIYLSFLFDRRFASKLSQHIDIPNSTISILCPPEENSNKKKTENKSKPTKFDAQIAALMSHYVYFYLDWLEYYRVHVNGIRKRILEKISSKKDNVNEVVEIINEYNIINGFFFASFGGIISFGETKVKGRIINRLREIARVTNNRLVDEVTAELYKDFKKCVIDSNKIDDFCNKLYKYLTKEEKKNEFKEKIEKNVKSERGILWGIVKNVLNKTLFRLLKGEEKIELESKERFRKFINDICALDVYIDILLESKKKKRPVGFYELYDKFGYWDYLKNDTLKNEAKQWYVSHPYTIYKNDYDILEKRAKEENNSLIEAYNKILWLLPRKTNEIFIAIEENLLSPRNTDESNKTDTSDIQTGKDNCHQETSTDGNKNTSNTEKRWLVYNTVLTHGMDQLSGYGGLLFTKVNSNGEAEKYAYCTKGTDVNSFNDWVLADVLQGLSGFSLQHLHNVKNAITINEKVGDKPLFYCGHSLGGGLASACAIASKGRHAITFNAAGLNFLGVIATRTLGGCNYGWDVPKMVHPIRIDGEVIDVVMLFSFLLLAHLNERAYGEAPLILKLKGRGLGSFLYDLSETGTKHGINNFLYKPLMNALDIVEKKTIKYPVKNVNLKNTAISTLGIDQIELVEKTDGKMFRSGEYTLIFKKEEGTCTFKSYLQCSYEDIKKLFSEVNIKKLHPSMKESAIKYLKEVYDFECS